LIFTKVLVDRDLESGIGRDQQQAMEVKAAIAKGSGEDLGSRL
jgi:hypothetical protein